jgi:hypothetical protein
MRHRLGFSSLLFLALSLALVPTALASRRWYVDGVNGSDNHHCKSPQTACRTIGHAISLASSGDSIMVSAATYTEKVTIGFSLTIVGSGSSTTIIDGRGVRTPVTISSTDARVTLAKVRIQHGAGGGIINTGTLTINKCAVTRNTSQVSAGGISNGGTLTINDSTVNANDAFGGRGTAGGGGIYNFGALTVNNSTLVGNRAHGLKGSDGGAIYNTGTLAVNNSTFSGNSGDSITNDQRGGKATIQNSIVANSTSGGNCGGTIISNGYNLSSDSTCNFNNTGDLNNTNPKLGPLQYNGGPTQTQALLSGSPAIDVGNPSGCTDGQGHLLKTDQRGKPRPDKEDTGGCDMGAFERQSD